MASFTLQDKITMSEQHLETNPHFPPSEGRQEEQPRPLPTAGVQQRTRDRQDHGSLSLVGPWWRPQRRRQGQDSQQQTRHDHRPDHESPPLGPWWNQTQQHRQDHDSQHQQRHDSDPLGPWGALATTNQDIQEPQTGPPVKKPKRQAQGRQPQKHVTVVPPLPQAEDQRPASTETRPLNQGSFPPSSSPEGGRPSSQPHGLLPKPRPTRPLTWFGAVFCVIFWIIVILGGLAVLIVYLVFRPHIPRFDVSGVTLNEAYIDVGYLLNADLSLLLNFTNPNKKVSIDFSYMSLYLYFESTLIATQYVEPFSAAKGESMFANIHMVTSQVRLSMKEGLLLQKQIENNRVILQIKGVFRARSNFGSLLRYSYWLHGRCSVLLSSPPAGVLKESKCKTKH